MLEYGIYLWLWVVFTAIVYIVFCLLSFDGNVRPPKQQLLWHLKWLGWAAVITTLAPLMGMFLDWLSTNPESEEREWFVRFAVISISYTVVAAAWFMTIEMGRFPRPLWVRELNIGLLGLMALTWVATGASFIKWVF